MTRIHFSTLSRLLLALRIPHAAVAAAALLPAMSSGGEAPSSHPPEVIGRMSGIDVSSDELRAYLESLGAQDRAMLAKDPAALSQVVRAYLARRAVLKEAQAKKWDQQPTIKAQLDRAREQGLIELYLDSVSRPPDGFPTDAEVKAAYEANKAAFEVPRQFRLSQIFLVGPAETDKEGVSKARQKLDQVVAKLKQKGADFAAIARTDSDDKESAPRGGEIGWLTESQMVPGIRSAVTLAKEGVSEPIRLDDGWHLLKVLETKPAFTRPLAEARESIATQLRADRARANRQAYLTKLLEQNPPTINELALPKVLAKAK
jgi:peptidylprolyl isomerase